MAVKKKRTKEDVIRFLQEKKARDGKLNKLGEWILSGATTGAYIEPQNMKYVMR